MKYKIITNRNNEFSAILCIETQYHIPADVSNRYYQKFLEDVLNEGIEIVEGANIIQPSYRELRAQEYPSLEEQQDMQYWDSVNETTVWKDTITSIKEKYPKTIEGGIEIGEVPSWIQTDVDNWVYNQKLNKYITALETLINFTVYGERPEVDDEDYSEYQKSLSIINEFVNEYLNS